MFTDALQNLGAFYLNGADPSDPRASPLFGDLDGMPPLLFHVGESELLRDDSVRFVDAARAAGVRAELKVWDGAPHSLAVHARISCPRRANRLTKPRPSSQPRSKGEAHERRA